MKTMHCVSLVVLSLGLGALMTGCVGAVDDEDVSMSTTDDAEQALMASNGAKAAIAEALSKAMAVGGGNAISIANAFATFTSSSPYGRDPCVALAVGKAFSVAYGGGDAVAITTAVAGVSC